MKRIAIILAAMAGSIALALLVLRIWIDQQ